MDILEFISYGSCLIIILSFFIGNMANLRLTNIAWGTAFMLYGIGNQTYLIGILNIIIVTINCYYLLKGTKITQAQSTNS